LFLFACNIIVNEQNETAENENANEQSVESDNEQDDMDCEDSDFEFEQTDEFHHWLQLHFVQFQHLSVCWILAFVYNQTFASVQLELSEE
jgi:hypothetical protein